MIAAFTSTEPTHLVSRSVPFVDTRDYGALTGGYPWRIDGDYTSIMLVTNIGGSRAAIAGFIRPSGGKDYRIDTRYLEPGETIVFDIKQIRDQQFPDPNGIKLAKNVTAGQFEWSSVLGDGKERLFGRADITSLSLGVSSPPTYYQCNCPLSAIGAFVTPGALFVGVGGETSATTDVQYKDICDGDESDAAFAALNWLIQNPPVLSLTTKISPSTVKGLSSGTSTFSTTFTGETWLFSPSNGCQSSHATYKPGGTGTVQKPTASIIVSQISSVANNSCPSGQAGWSRQVLKAVTDQNGNPIKLLGQNLNETVTITAPNQLYLQNPQTGTAVTDGNGQFTDTFFDCSAKCPGTGQTDASQAINDVLPTGLGPYGLSPNALVYGCSSITVNGQ